ncbi:MAG: site-specific tyrosine recombinase XerD [Gammaproteobacteria bacterium]|nr:MAG: site-specific tyrosine recombinase XerD [Gammaproteobacteria bacterium]
MKHDAGKEKQYQSDQWLIDRFLESCWIEKGLSDNTIDAYNKDLKQFCQHLSGTSRLASCTTSDIQRFLAHLLHAGLTAQTICRKLSSLRRFFQHLYRDNIRHDNPCDLIDRPKLGRPLPRTLSEKEVTDLLNAPDTETILGSRDRAMLELMYASGLRVSELISMKHYQLDLTQGFVRIMGKGNKERLVPFGENAQNWLENYLQPGGAREQLANRKKISDAVFITHSGEPMSRQAFWYLIRKYARLAQIQTPLSPHTLRHAFATHLLNHGADLRVLQMLLGHSNVSTTQIYTNVATKEIQRLHSEHHPRG